MLFPKDIQKLIEVFAIRVDLEEIKKDFVNLQSSVDAYAKKADKLGVKLDY